MKNPLTTNQKHGLLHRRHPWFRFHSMARDLDHIFDDFPMDWDWAFPHVERASSLFSPRVNVEDQKDVIQVTAELPGMTEKEIDVELLDNTLTLRGEKESQQEEDKKNYYRKECSYGAFNRVIPLPCDVNGEKVQAKFKKGILHISLPKSEKAKERTRKIEISA